MGFFAGLNDEKYDRQYPTVTFRGGSLTSSERR